MDRPKGETDEGAGISLPRRTAIGLVGGPGSGKSTITQGLVARLNQTGVSAAAIPMDGFHMRQAKLDRLGLAARKGAPETFEAEAFADFLTALKSTGAPLSGPIYTRDIEDVTEDGYTVPQSTNVLIVEGNYLLLDNSPWDRVRPLLDLAIYLDVLRETVKARLLARHAEYGLFSPDHIARHVEQVDMPNYDLVAETARRADIVVSTR